ncbi:MAG: hypothetical protein M3401_02935 [Actinomycetota bacterium]|nr:hypothetical protein [Actinomycetota bacterium]
MSQSEAQRPDEARPVDVDEVADATQTAADDPQIPDDLSEEELRAAYEEELKHIRVDDVLVQTVISLLNLAARRAGLTGAGDEEIDLAQVGQAIEATRALLPLVEPVLGSEVKQIRDALSQLQLAYARSGATASAAAGGEDPAEPKPAAPKDGTTGPAQSSGRLWVPGQ